MNEATNLKLSDILAHQEKIVEVLVDRGATLGLTVLQASLTLIIGWLVAGWVYRLIRRALGRTSMPC